MNADEPDTCQHGVGKATICKDCDDAIPEVVPVKSPVRCRTVQVTTGGKTETLEAELHEDRLVLKRRPNGKRVGYPYARLWAIHTGELL